MDEYIIKRWDALLIGKSVNPVPVIHVQSSSELDDFARKNNNAILVIPRGTDSIYDNKRIAGQWVHLDGDEAVIILQAAWYGYPDKSGICEILGFKGKSEDVKVKSSMLYTPSVPEDKGAISSIDITFTFWIFVFLVIVFFLSRNLTR